MLEELQQRRRRHPQVLDLLARCYRELGEWDALLQLLPAMQKAGVLDEDKAVSLRQQAAAAGLKKCREPDELKQRFGGLPRQMQRTPEVTAAFADQAISLVV